VSLKQGELGKGDTHETRPLARRLGGGRGRRLCGVSAIVRRGDEVLVDKGKIWIDDQTGRIIRSIGPHPLRELMDGSFNVALALPGFCEILRP
jgi:hypothetical protein